MNSSVITGINPQVRKRERYSVYIDGEYAFSVHARALAHLGLQIGQSVDARSLQEIAAADNEAKALEAALRFLKVRNQSAGEIKRKLSEKGYERQTVEKVVIRLQALGLLDDTRFVEAWIGHSLAHRPVGRRKLVEDLLEKGVDRTLIEEAVASQVDREREVELAARLVRDKCHGSTAPSDRAATQKLVAMLRRRGFTGDVIEAVLHEAAEVVE